jgi:hypothetical protein
MTTMVISVSLFFVASILIALFVALHKSFKDYPLQRHFIYCSIFLCYGMTIHFSGKSIFFSIANRDAMHLLSTQNQLLILLFVINLILQAAMMSKRDIAFLSFLIPPAINLIFCVIAMFLTTFGIVNVVWSLIYTGCLCGYMLVLFFLNGTRNSILTIPMLVKFEHKAQFIENLRKDADKWMKIGVQSFLALGAALGVSMSILFKDGNAGLSNPDTQMTAAIMVTSFLWIVIGALFALVKPYLEIHIQLNEFQNKIIYDASGKRKYVSKRNANGKNISAG